MQFLEALLNIHFSSCKQMQPKNTYMTYQSTNLKQNKSKSIDSSKFTYHYSIFSCNSQQESNSVFCESEVHES